MPANHIIRKLQSIFAILAMLSISLQPSAVQAQSGDGLTRQVNAGRGKVSFLAPEGGRPLPAARALGTSLRFQDPALALAERFGPEFGLQNPGRELAEQKRHTGENGRLTVRYQQEYEGIPVLGGELIVNTNQQGDLYSMNGEVSPDLSLPTQPTITSTQARETALQSLAKWYEKTPEDFVSTEPELWIYDESLLQPSTRPAELVWRMNVISADGSLPVRELVLVHAGRGHISLHFNQVDTAWGTTSSISSRPIPKAEPLAVPAFGPGESLVGSQSVHTYTAGNSTSLPGTFLCDQNAPACTNGGDPHADKAHLYAIGTYHLYLAKHNRNGINGSNLPILSTVHYGFNYGNAFWDGTQMVYGDGYGFPLADDVVAHELSHGVTEYESNLFYYYQSGAINESFSDLWGEFYDQTNDMGDDGPGVRWLVGEDVSGYGALRHMSSPPYYGDPDSMTSPYYSLGAGDNGGVHSNSGVNNKAVSLMVDGGFFNGRTVSALGWDKTAAVYYHANTNLLTSGADYSDLYYALQQACSSLIGQKGITAGDCQEVKDAIDAVEMNSQPVSNFNTDAPLCNSQLTSNTIFFDNLESGSANWSFDNGAHVRWQYNSPYGPYAHSGTNSLYADDYPYAVTNASATLRSTVIPAGAYLHFAHAYDFESYGLGYHFDGGVLEYSLNGGASWVDAAALMEHNGYTGQISSSWNNPLKGRIAFVGSSHGYISTRLNLASLAGQSVMFRWRMGLDSFGSSWGWWLDDVRIYTCTLAITGNVGVGGATVSYTDGTARSVISQANGDYFLQVSDNWSGTVTPTHPCYTFSPTSRSYSNLLASQTGQNYTPTFAPTPACANTVGVFRPANGLLYLKNTNTSGFADLALNYGIPGDYPVVGDWDGDGDDTIGVYRSGTFLLRNSNTVGFADLVFVFGVAGDQPIAGDWNGDGIDTIGIFRPSTGQFLLRNSNTAGPAEIGFFLGNPGDVGIAGDWDGDGDDTTGVFRPSNGVIFLKNTNTSGFADIALNYGIPGDKPVAGDWDGDGDTTIGVYRNGRFYLRNQNSVGFADILLDLGNPGDMPIAGNWDGLP